MCKIFENFFKNELDVCLRFVYNSRHTDTVKLERLSDSNESARQSRARQFSISRTFRGTTVQAEMQRYRINLPGGVPERIKRGKEKVVTRAVACAKMKLRGVSERGYTVLMNRKIHWSSNFLIKYYGEFDSGSERTLAAWIRHASRTK